VNSNVTSSAAGAGVAATGAAGFAQPVNVVPTMAKQSNALRNFLFIYSLPPPKIKQIVSDDNVCTIRYQNCSSIEYQSQRFYEIKFYSP